VSSVLLGRTGPLRQLPTSAVLAWAIASWAGVPVRGGLKNTENAPESLVSTSYLLVLLIESRGKGASGCDRDRVALPVIQWRSRAIVAAIRVPTASAGGRDICSETRI